MSNLPLSDPEAVRHEGGDVPAEVLNRYRFEVRYDPPLADGGEDGDFLVTAPAFPGHSAFGDTPEEALREGRIALEAIIGVMLEHGDELPPADAGDVDLSAYSGNIRLRMPRSLHASLARRAEREGVSLNTLMLTLLSRQPGGAG